MSASMALLNIPSEKPCYPKTMNLEVDKEPEVKCDEENDAPVEGKKIKKKDGKKEKAKRKICVFTVTFENQNRLNVVCMQN